MSKVFIEETTLTAIGDAIREKEGTTELVPVNDMATRISTLQTGEELPAEIFYLTGEGNYRFASGGWDWFINMYGDRVTTANITGCNRMFSNSKVTKVPFVINVSKDCKSFEYACGYMTNLEDCPKFRGLGNFVSTTYFSSFFQGGGTKIKDIDDLFDPEELTALKDFKVTSKTASPRPMNFLDLQRIKRVPRWWYKWQLNPESTAFPTYHIYSQAFASCYNMGEVLNIPVWTCTAASTSNMFSNFVNKAYRLRDLTFEVNEDGTPKVAKWSGQTLDLTTVGFEVSGYTISESNLESRLQTYCSVYKADPDLTSDKCIYSTTRYNELKDDPESFVFAVSGQQFSRYNHDSAVRTINSLPDCSATGTNTIKFKGAAGSATDGGAINTLTEEEIAVATAKGWTVTLV